MSDSNSNTDADWALYRYSPSLAAAVVFIICFILTTALHIFQMIRTRAWIAIPLVVGGFFEWIGYIGRAMSSQETPDWTLGPYIIQTLLILVAPALFAASIYMLLGRIILAVDGFHLALIKRKWLTKLFVLGDVLSFSMQAAGGGIMAGGSESSLQLGERVIIVGLFVQLVMFGFFVAVAAHFHVNFARKGNKLASGSDQPVPWRRYLLALYTASGFIVIRSIFRVVEYIQGNDGYLMRHEIFLYIFDALLMLVVMVVLNVVHPGQLTTYLRRAGLTRGEGHHPLTVRV